jgi:hypothetical protein
VTEFPKTRRFLRSALTHSWHGLPEKRPSLQQDGEEIKDASDH